MSARFAAAVTAPKRTQTPPESQSLPRSAYGRSEPGATEITPTSLPSTTCNDTRTSGDKPGSASRRQKSSTRSLKASASPLPQALPSASRPTKSRPPKVLAKAMSVCFASSFHGWHSASAHRRLHHPPLIVRHKAPEKRLIFIQPCRLLHFSRFSRSRRRRFRETPKTPRSHPSLARNAASVEANV